MNNCIVFYSVGGTDMIRKHHGFLAFEDPTD